MRKVNITLDTLEKHYGAEIELSDESGSHSLDLDFGYWYVEILYTVELEYFDGGREYPSYTDQMIESIEVGKAYYYAGHGSFEIPVELNVVDLAEQFSVGKWL